MKGYAEKAKERIQSKGEMNLIKRNPNQVGN